MRRLLLVPLTAVALYGCADQTPTGPLVEAAPGTPRFGAFPGANGKIVFASTRSPGGGIVTTELGSFTVETVRSTGSGPAWSADGTRLVFVDDDGGDLDVFVMNADGTGVVQLTDNTVRDESPSWSPDGNLVAFHSELSGTAQIYTLPVSGGTPTALTSEGANFGPSYSPDGTKIAFTSTRDGNSDIYVMDANGDNQLRLTSSVHSDYDPSWSPDGSRIVFTHQESNPGDPPQIYVMDADGTDPTNMSALSGYAGVTAAWSPDGSRILFASSQDGNSEIYVMWAVDPVGAQNLSNDAGSDIHPDWQPVPDDPGGPSAAELVQQLADHVTGLAMHKGTKNSLLALLGDVLSALEADQTGLACGGLNDFISKVSAQSGKKISASDAAALIEEASMIAEELGCVAGSECYPDLAAPALALESTTVQDGTVRFELDVTNFASFPDALFEPAPDLAPCGLNTSASRTWIDIRDGNGNFLFGFCSFGQASDLNQLWFLTPEAEWPAEAYIVLTDRRCNITYTSNRINLAGIL
jgi:hypothetical protein